MAKGKFRLQAPDENTPQVGVCVPTGKTNKDGTPIEECKVYKRDSNGAFVVDEEAVEPLLRQGFRHVG